ncbi:hypothetical protein DYB38_010497 [Aphanomyces astaci]|uniref:Uncharacterized protein n=1 Tax=Aphanomyces astaci TaxID=112090 RepID=A0A397C5T8_APHAT|nr:hypothetical protein DYB38_010497 [Aphanomyces astaci]
MKGVVSVHGKLNFVTVTMKGRLLVAASTAWLVWATMGPVVAHHRLLQESTVDDIPMDDPRPTLSPWEDDIPTLIPTPASTTKP